MSITLGPLPKNAKSGRWTTCTPSCSQIAAGSQRAPVIHVKDFGDAAVNVKWSAGNPTAQQSFVLDFRLPLKVRHLESMHSGRIAIGILSGWVHAVTKTRQAHGAPHRPTDDETCVTETRVGPSRLLQKVAQTPCDTLTVSDPLWDLILLQWVLHGAGVSGP